MDFKKCFTAITLITVYQLQRYIIWSVVAWIVKDKLSCLLYEPEIFSTCPPAILHFISVLLHHSQVYWRIFSTNGIHVNSYLLLAQSSQKIISSLQVHCKSNEWNKETSFTISNCIGFGSLGVNIRLHCAWHVFPRGKLGFVATRSSDGPSI